MYSVSEVFSTTPYKMCEWNVYSAVGRKKHGQILRQHTIKCWVTQPNFNHLLDSTTVIHLMPMVEFRWYKMYRWLNLVSGRNLEIESSKWGCGQQIMTMAEVSPWWQTGSRCELNMSTRMVCHIISYFGRWPHCLDISVTCTHTASLCVTSSQM